MVMVMVMLQIMEVDVQVWVVHHYHRSSTRKRAIMCLITLSSAMMQTTQTQDTELCFVICNEYWRNPR